MDSDKSASMGGHSGDPQPRSEPVAFLHALLLALPIGFVTIMMGIHLPIKGYLRQFRGLPPASPVPFATQVLGVVGMTVLFSIFFHAYLRISTRHRRSDPYRFSRNHCRKFSVPLVEVETLIGLISALGFALTKRESSGAAVVLTFRRTQIQNLDRYRETNFPTPHFAAVILSCGHGSANGMVHVFPESRFVLADFKNTLFDASEEIVATLERGLPGTRRDWA